MKRSWIFLAGLGMALGASGTQADEKLPAELRAVQIEQHVNAQVPLDLEFIDEQGRTVRLGDCTDGKPAILVMAYYRCPMLCTEVLNGLVAGLRKVPFQMGRDYHVVTVSFDAREVPELAAAKKQSYVGAYGRPGAEEGWHFLTGKQEAIDRLAETVGFRFHYDPQKDQFAHDSGVMVLTPEGRVSRYLFGVLYRPVDLRLALGDASDHKIGSVIDRYVLHFCFRYDFTTGKYTAAVMRAVRVSGILTVILLATLLGRAFWRERRRGQQAAGEVAIS